MRLTLDASVWISAYATTEPGHGDSRALVDAILLGGAGLVEPTLFPVEVAGAIARTRGEALARQMSGALLALPLIRWVSLDESIAARALTLAADHRLRGADAVYAAVALAHGCSLVSLDHEHLTRLTSVVPTMTPAAAGVTLATRQQP